MGLLQPVLAEQTQVCPYDRAGFGWSDPATTPRTAQQNASGLHALLTNAGLAGPYLLVGHSFGVNVSRVYAAHYPDQVAGVVLVDPGVSFGRPGVPPTIEAQWQNQIPWFILQARWFTRVGLWRLGAAAGALPGPGDLPAAYSAPFLAFQVTTKAQEPAMISSATCEQHSQQVASGRPHPGCDLCLAQGHCTTRLAS